MAFHHNLVSVYSLPFLQSCIVFFLSFIHFIISIARFFGVKSSITCPPLAPLVTLHNSQTLLTITAFENANANGITPDPVASLYGRTTNSAISK